MKLKIALALLAGAVFGGLGGVLAGFFLWWTPQRPTLLLTPTKPSVAAGAKESPAAYAYLFAADNVQCYYDSNGWFSVAPLKDKMPRISIHNKGNDEVEVSVAGKPRAVITVRVADSKIESFSLENGVPGNRVSQFDLGADGAYDFVDIDTDGRKESKVQVDGAWYTYASEGGKNYAEVNGVLRELVTGETGAHFKPQEAEVRGVDVP